MGNVLRLRTEKNGSDGIKVRRQEEILEAAATLFAECGYSDADTQTLADRLGVGKGTIYRYFPSKQELFLAAVDLNRPRALAPRPEPGSGTGRRGRIGFVGREVEAPLAPIRTHIPSCPQGAIFCCRRLYR